MLNKGVSMSGAWPNVAGPHRNGPGRATDEWACYMNEWATWMEREILCLQRCPFKAGGQIEGRRPLIIFEK